MANKADVQTNRRSQTQAKDEQQPGPARMPDNATSPGKFAQRVFAQVTERLEREFADFRERSTIEEQRIMIDIFNDHMNRTCGGAPRSPGEYEVALYSAIERQLSGNVCVIVPDDELIPKVEAFIVELQRRRKPRSYALQAPETEEGICSRLSDRFRSEVELFARDARHPSLLLMLKLLARWNAIAADPEARKLRNTLAAAAEIELDKLMAENAAEEAIAA